MVTHPILSGKAYDNLNSSVLEVIVVSDTIPLHQESPKIHVLTTAHLFAEVVRRVRKKESISSLFKF
jgi:ribose-phosphate pyrophosphokinase